MAERSATVTYAAADHLYELRVEILHAGFDKIPVEERIISGHTLTTACHWTHPKDTKKLYHDANFRVRVADVTMTSFDRLIRLNSRNGAFANECGFCLQSMAFFLVNVDRWRYPRSGGRFGANYEGAAVKEVIYAVVSLPNVDQSKSTVQFASFTRTWTEKRDDASACKEMKEEVDTQEFNFSVRYRHHQYERAPPNHLERFVAPIARAQLAIQKVFI